MILRSEPCHLQGGDALLQRRILQLPDRPAFRTDHVVMILRQHPQLILHGLRRQVMAHDQAAVDQHLKRIVNSSLADVEIHILQFLVKDIHVEMAGETAYAFQDGIPFLRLPQFLLYQIPGKLFPHLCVLFCIHFQAATPRDRQS